MLWTADESDCVADGVSVEDVIGVPCYAFAVISNDMSKTHNCCPLARFDCCTALTCVLVSGIYDVRESLLDRDRHRVERCLCLGSFGCACDSRIIWEIAVAWS